MKFSWNPTIWSTVLACGLLTFNSNIHAQEEIVIEKGRSVTIEYVLTLDDGSVASTNVGQDPLTYTQGESEILPALENAMTGMKSGDQKKISLPAEDGYGQISEEAFVAVELAAVPEDARQVGTILVGRDGAGNERHVRVHEVHDDKIVIDHNHPLAGQTLHFEITVIGVE